MSSDIFDITYRLGLVQMIVSSSHQIFENFLEPLTYLPQDLMSYVNVPLRIESSLDKGLLDIFNVDV